MRWSLALMCWRAPAIRPIAGRLLFSAMAPARWCWAPPKSLGIISTHLHADGSYGELLTLPNADRVEPENPIYLTMAGNEVFKVAVTELAHIVDETLAANNLERSALDWLVPHQANLRIISATAKKLGMSMDNVVVTLDRHGNTSAASVPCALDEAVRDGRIQRGQLILLEAFGGGFTGFPRWFVFSIRI